MKRGFIRLIELFFAMMIIFTVLNSVQTGIPPRYEDVNNLPRLQRYAGDIAFSICNTPDFREDVIKNKIPVNISVQADAWNKTNSTRTWATDGNSERTIRQITHMNKSTYKIRLCYGSADATTADMSVCESSNVLDCVAGTISNDYTNNGAGAGYHCTDWFYYNINKSKQYLILMHTIDFDYFAYYSTGIHGHYYKESVDETQTTTGSGYTNASTDPLDLRIDAFHDLGINETMPIDMDYKIWIYKNDSFDWKLDDLINETGKNSTKATATASCLIAGYKDVYSPRKVVVGVWNK